MQRSHLLALKGLIALSFLVGLGIWVDANLNWQEILTVWALIDPYHVAAIVVLVMLSHVIRATRIHHAYKQAHSVRWASITGVSFTHNTLSFLLPMRLGELALPLLSRNRLNIPIGYSSATLVLIRIFDAHWLLILLGLFAGSTLLNGSALWIVGILVASMPVGLALLSNFTLKSERFTSIRPLVSQRRTLIILYLYTGLIWVLKLSALAYLSATLGDIALHHAWIATIIADASALSPITGFANAGTFEAAFALPLLPLGYESSATVITALNLHLLILVTNIAAGAIGFTLLLFNKTPKASQ